MLLDEHLERYPEDLQKIVNRISEISKLIKIGFLNNREISSTSNVYGEQQLALDKWADSMLIDGLGKSGLVKFIASEEQPELLNFKSSSNIAMTIDPLDGSSLIDVNLTVGTIVGLHKDNVLKKGDEMLGAIYILYGPLTILVYSLGNGVHEFILNEKGQFVLLNENLTIPHGNIYSPGALRCEWLPYHIKWIKTLEDEGYKLRYSGSFVADVHQILQKGGVFSYPAYKNGLKGKLRLLYECIPMGYLIKKAGGAVSDGTKDLLSIAPESIHQRCPIYIGGKKEIQLIECIMRGDMK